MYAYKLAQRKSTAHQYSSLTSHGKVTHYEHGRWHKAPFGGFICFKTYRDMCDFMPGPVDWAMLLVEVEDEVELPPYRSIGGAVEARALWERERWNNESQMPHWRVGWPKGSVAFKRLRIIKELSHVGD